MKQGFTLLELSIVLVVIGLMAGSVLVGQELLAAARVRSQITQIEQFNSAVNTFETKYGSLPGDMVVEDLYKYELHYARALANECHSELARPVVVAGNGNGVVGGATSATLTDCGQLEEIFFWFALFDANLISGYYAEQMWTPPGDFAGDFGIFYNDGRGFPFSKIIPGEIVTGGFNGRQTGALISIVSLSDKRHFFRIFRANLGAPGTCRATNANIGAWCETLSPAIALAIDSKMDDGMPMGGNVRASQGYSVDENPDTYYNSPTNGAQGAAVCTFTSSGTTYYNAGVETPYLCSLYMQASF